MKDKPQITNFALVGSGRVATHLATALVANGLECVALYSPTRKHADRLAGGLNSHSVGSMADIVALEVDFVLVSIKDDAISEVSKAFPIDYKGVVLHTSGGTSIEALQPIPHRGVLYPMQTFSHEREVDITDVPIFLEVSDSRAKAVVEQLAKVLGSRVVRYLTSEERVKLHLASVFACNFVNHLYAISDTVLKDIGLDFTYLAPLVKETLQKALTTPPNEVQTGPAVRNDQKTIARHIGLLQGYPKELYKLLTESIMSGISK